MVALTEPQMAEVAAALYQMALLERPAVNLRHQTQPVMTGMGSLAVAEPASRSASPPVGVELLVAAPKPMVG